MGNLRPIVSAEYVANAMRYDPETGKLFWKYRSDVNDGWNTKYAGTEAFTAITDTGYKVGNINARRYRAHRVAWAIHYGEWPEHEVDHINGNRTDNRIENLRPATASENGCNKGLQSNNVSGYAGVHWDKSKGKWVSYIKKNGKRKHLGRFDDIQEAIAIRDAAVIEYHKEYGRLSNGPA